MDTEVIERLDGGLLLRRATAADAEEPGRVQRHRLRRAGPARPPHRHLDARPAHPTPPHLRRTAASRWCRTPPRGRIVSSLCLIPQTWSYGGVPFGVGRVELVGTLPEYRRRGLIRRQMEEVHRWSAALGHPVQIITGIANFYRQFGYEQGLPMGGARGRRPPADPGAARGPRRAVPRPPGHRRGRRRSWPGWRSRPAPRSLLSVPRDAALWRYEIEGRSEGHAFAPARARHRGGVGAARGRAGERVGSSCTGPARAPTVWVTAYELLPGVSWLAVTPGVLRYLKALGDALGAAGASTAPDARPALRPRSASSWGRRTPSTTPSPHAGRRPSRRTCSTCASPDLPGFLRHIGGVLERRLAESVAVGHSGRLRLSFYRDGVLLRFRDGRLAEVRSRARTSRPARRPGPVGARFPGLTFLQVLFGCPLARRAGATPSPTAGPQRGGPRPAARALPQAPSLIWPVS